MSLVDPEMTLDDGIRISAVKYPPPVWMRLEPKAS